MTNEELIQRFASINIWRKGDQRAPHKPLVVLTALANLQQKGTSRLIYAEHKDHLVQLLKDFGPQRRSYHPEEPFVRLSNDKSNLWQVNSTELLDTKSPNSGTLVRTSAFGQFTNEIEQHLRNHPSAVTDLALAILNEHFPGSIHQDIIDAVGLNLTVLRQVRDSAFRNKIMIAYERKCAVCNFNVQLGDTYIGLDAAHIKWKKAYGPDSEENGLLLCTMHHKLFDRGAFTLNDKMEIMVSDQAHGTFGFKEWLMDYHGAKIRLPQRKHYYPEPSFTSWHVSEVFHGSYRDKR